MRLWRSRVQARSGEAEREEASELRARPRPEGLRQLQHDLGNQALRRALEAGGRSLDPAARRFMEERFGRDLGDVRLHSGPAAEAAAEEAGARAFTVGTDIVVGGGVDPETPAGRELLAHELTHVVQQGEAGLGDAPGGLRTTDRSDRAEAEARALAPRAAAGERVHPQVATGPALARDEVAAGKPEPETPALTARLDRIAATYRAMIAAARKRGHAVAADNLQRFLDGTGGTAVLDTAWLRGFGATTDAERTNQARFEGSLSRLAKGIRHGGHGTHDDYWDRTFTASVATELYYASGTSTIRSTGHFTLEGIEDLVRIAGNVRHHWFDPYDWHAGLGAYVPGFGVVSDDDALLLQRYRGAKPFMMEADWMQWLSGTYTHRRYWFDSASYDWSGP